MGLDSIRAFFEGRPAEPAPLSEGAKAAFKIDLPDRELPKTLTKQDAASSPSWSVSGVIKEIRAFRWY
jgi:hypothetical protein